VYSNTTNLRVSPASSHISEYEYNVSAIGARIGAQVIAGFKGSENTEPFHNDNDNDNGNGRPLHDGENFNTSQGSSPILRNSPPPRFEYPAESMTSLDNSWPTFADETNKSSHKGWFSSIRKLFRRKDKHPLDSAGQTGVGRHRPRIPGELDNEHTPTKPSLDGRLHSLGKDHMDDKHVRKYRGDLAWNSLIALGFAMYLGVSLAITVRNWLYLELGMENKGMYVHIYIYIYMHVQSITNL
jgi:hypothetical protein